MEIQNRPIIVILTAHMLTVHIWTTIDGVNIHNKDTATLVREDILNRVQEVIFVFGVESEMEYGVVSADQESAIQSDKGDNNMIKINC